MSDTKKVTAYVVARDKVTNIAVSGAFYERITGLYFNYIKKLPVEKTEEFMQAIAKDEIPKIKNGDDQVDAYAIETLLILMSTIEEKFKEEDMIKKEEFEIPNED